MSLSAQALADKIEFNIKNTPIPVFGGDQVKKYFLGGTNTKKFCLAIATGIVMSIVGKSFKTLDAGITPGSGVGAGTGIKGLAADDMSSTALQLIPVKGVNCKFLFDVIMYGVKDHLEASATLTSTHSPVAVGKGKVIPSSIVLPPTEMAKNINSQLSSVGAAGSNVALLSLAVATGICLDVLKNGTGDVTIVGSPGSIPSPGIGSGSGVIS